MDEQRTITVPWLVVTTEAEPVLLVSAPNGNIVELPCREDTAEHLDALLNSDVLWKTFFTTLLTAIEERSPAPE